MPSFLAVRYVLTLLQSNIVVLELWQHHNDQPAYTFSMFVECIDVLDSVEIKKPQRAILWLKRDNQRSVELRYLVGELSTYLQLTSYMALLGTYYYYYYY